MDFFEYRLVAIEAVREACMVSGSGLMVEGLWFRLEALEVRVWGIGFRV